MCCEMLFCGGGAAGGRMKAEENEYKMTLPHLTSIISENRADGPVAP